LTIYTATRNNSEQIEFVESCFQAISDFVLQYFAPSFKLQSQICKCLEGITTSERHANTQIANKHVNQFKKIAQKNTI